MDNLISFIVPSYNFANYIGNCVQSILAQTYKNIEVIIINDGSTDNSKEIIDKLTILDNRVKAIHKNNEGVSIARNTGIENSKGDYIVFVDADDYLAPDYAEYMMSLVNSTGADFCLSTDCYMNSNEKQNKKEYILSYTPTQATALLLSPKVVVGSWNKIFKKSFLIKNNLLFSTKLFYGEGLKFITTAAQLANCVGVGNRKVYYYRRDNEFSATTKYNVQKYRNGESALDKILEDLLVKDASVMLMFKLHKSVFCLGALSQTYAHSLQRTYKNDCIHWRSVILEYIPKLLCSYKVSIYRKCLLLGGVLFPSIVCKLDMWRRKRVAKYSVK